jgi:SAM-dependent methyltransferase
MPRYYGMIMSDAWYDEIALRNGGYRSGAVFKRIGLSGEDAFERELIGLLELGCVVLDAGCGDGEFTLEIAERVGSIIGFDFSKEMVRIALEKKKRSGRENVEFRFASTKAPLPFRDGQFDLVYSRRGPTSIIEHSRLLKKGGCMMGIHSAAKDVVVRRIEESGLTGISVEEYPDSWLVFDDETEYAKYLTAFPGNPDFFLEENAGKLHGFALENAWEGRIRIQEWRFIWKGFKD